VESEQERQDDGRAADEPPAGGGQGGAKQKEGAGEGGSGAGGGDGGPEGRLAALTAERDELKDRLLRLAAEFDNWKKRARKEQSDGEAKAREGVLKDILEVVDNLERAVGAYGDGTNGAVDGPTVLKGVSLVLRLLQNKLERYDVRPMVARGEPFDPRQHEAISRTETKDVPAGHVAVELQRGYRIGERLLRPAMVSVAAAPAAGGGSPGEGDGN